VRPIGLKVLVGLGMMAPSVAGCGDVSTPTPPSEASAEACGDKDPCASEQFCIATQGAICQPLPPPGETCDEGCVLTEHCCNCTTHACLTAPTDDCPDGPTCECLAAGFLMGCEAERRTCESGAPGVHVQCVSVAYDEDPFAEPVGGSGGGGSGGGGL